MTKFLPIILLLASLVSAELINVNPDPNGEPWWAGGWKMPDAEEMAKIEAFPKLTLPGRYKKSGKALPYKLDNADLMFMRPVFNQMGGSCAQASGVGYVFTYHMNFLNNSNASLSANQFPTHYTYNFLNGGSGANGSTYFAGWDIIESCGVPNVDIYGGMWPSEDIDTMHRIWMNISDNYKSGMNKRIVETLSIPVGTPEGLETLKQYMNNYLDGSGNGGIVSFAAGVTGSNGGGTYRRSILPLGTENQGQSIILQWDKSVNHAMTFIGYNDSIRWDFNTDGKFSNHDSEGNLLPMSEWEIGGLLMMNSWGENWPANGAGGKSWVAYRTLAQTLEEGGIWKNEVHTIKIRDDFEPTLFLNTSINFDQRSELKIYAGVSTDTTAIEPDYTIQFPHFNRQGGEYGMQGVNNTLDFGFDISPLLSYVEPGQTAKFFLCVDHKEDGASSGRGTVTSFSVSDTSGNLFECPDSNVSIARNGTLYMTVNALFNFDPPVIQDETLPQAVPGEFYSYSLTSLNGTPPYIWDALFTYEEIENFNSFPIVTDSILSVTDNDDGYGIIDLPFSFPFYGELFDRVYVLTDGSIKFDEGFEYIRSEGDILAFRTITPYGADLMAYPEEGDGIFYTLTENSLTVRWVTSMWNQPEVDLEFACTLYSDSRIEFFYGDNLTTGISWGSGISNGKSTDAVISSTSNLNDPSGLKTAFGTTDYPYGIVLGEDGVLSGITNIPGNSWDINVRVTDDRNISDLKTLTFTTASGIGDYFSAVVSGFELYQNYPNPFNPVTQIRFALSKTSDVKLSVYNIGGQLVSELLNKKMNAGFQKIDFDGSKLNSGLYYYTLEVDGISKTQKMTILK